MLEQNAAKDEIRPWPVEWKTRNKMSILPLSFHQLGATSDMARDPWGKCPGLESSEESIPAKLDCENSSYWKKLFVERTGKEGGELGAWPKA